MEMNSMYIVAKYYNEIDTVISSIDNTDLDSGRDTVYKDFNYTKTDGSTGSISQFYKAVITYDKIANTITVTEHQLNKDNEYTEIGTVSLTVDEYNRIKSLL